MSQRMRRYLLDILDYIERIEVIASFGEANFLTSKIHQDAVIRDFEVIGEIIKRLDATLLALRPEIAWKDYAGFRDILIHQYDKVIVSLVWRSALYDLHPLGDAVKMLIEHIDSFPDESS